MTSTIEISLKGRLGEIKAFIFMMEVLQSREMEKDKKGNSLFNKFFNNKKGTSSRELSYSDTINILKSNAYLMMYNVIEFTVSNLIELIYEDIKINNLSYKDVSESIRKIFLNNYIKPLNDPNASFRTILKKIEELASFMINSDVLILNRKDSLPAGNLDGKNIKKIMSSHGIKLNFRDQVCNIFDNLKQKKE